MSFLGEVSCDELQTSAPAFNQKYEIPHPHTGKRHVVDGSLSPWKHGRGRGLTEIPGFVRLFGPERLHGFPDERIEAFAALLQMTDDFLAHSRRPKFSEVTGYSRDRIVMPLGRKKFADLICHIDKFFWRRVMRHDAWPGR